MDGWMDGRMVYGRSSSCKGTGVRACAGGEGVQARGCARAGGEGRGCGRASVRGRRGGTGSRLIVRGRQGGEGVRACERARARTGVRMKGQDGNSKAHEGQEGARHVGRRAPVGPILLPPYAFW